MTDNINVDLMDMVVIRTGAVKALGDGRVGGMLVRFTSPDDPDLAGDWFAPDTYLGEATETPVYYEHGLGDLGRVPIGVGRLERRDDGVWIEAQLDMARPEVTAIYKRAADGMLYWSSGTAIHLIRYEATGETRKITSWPLGVDASLTARPAEPRNRAIALKSLLPPNPEPEAGAAGGEEAGDADLPDPQPVPVKEQDEMSEELKTPQIDIDALAEALAAKFAPPVPPAPEPEPEGDPIKAFNAYLRTGRIERPLKSITEGGSGTAVVPVEYADQVVQDINAGDIFVRAGARVVPQSVLTAKWPVLSPASAGSAIAEEGAYPTTDPTLSEVTVTLAKYGDIVKVSEELAADARYDLWGNLLQPYFADFFIAVRNALGANAVTGQTADVTAASASAVTADELLQLMYSVPEQYRQNGAWIMNDSTLAAIHGLTGSDGHFLLSGLENGQPRLFGKPVYTVSDMPAFAANAKSIAFGDFGKLWVFEHPDMLAQRLVERYADTGHIGYKMARRMAAAVMLDRAIAVLQMAAA